MTGVARRRGLLALAAGALVLGGCSARASGWDGAEVDGLTVAVPSGWDGASGPGGRWTRRWTSPDGRGQLLVAPALSAGDAYAALDMVMSAARSRTRGFTPTGVRRAWSDGTTTVARQDYTATWPRPTAATIWAIETGGRTAVVELSGDGVTEEQRAGLGERLSLAAAGGTSSASAGASTASDLAAVEVDGVALAVPTGWERTGGAEGSARWTDGWALLSEDRVAQARILVAPRMPEDDVRTALAQIEVDHAAGSLPGYTVEAREELSLDGLEGVRTDFRSGAEGADGGCLWVVSDGDRVCAVQYVALGGIDASVRDGIQTALAVAGD